jgi:hypothetical protein
VTEAGAFLELNSAARDAAMQDAYMQAEAVWQSGEPIEAVLDGTKGMPFGTIDHQAFHSAVYIATLRRDMRQTLSDCP